MESFKFTTRQLQRIRPKQSSPCDPRYDMRSRPYPYVPLPPNQLVFPQGVLPHPPALSGVPVPPAAAQTAVRAPMDICFNCGQTDGFAREARKPVVPPEPNETVKASTEDIVECVAENCSGVSFCVNCK